MSKKPIDAKALREKLEGLYKDVDLTQDDKKILRNEHLSIVVKEHWENISSEELSRRKNKKFTEESRKKLSKLSKPGLGMNSPEKVLKRKHTRLKNGTERSPEEWSTIYNLFWGEDRNSKQLKEKVCKDYNVKPGTLHSLINCEMLMSLPQDIKDSHQQRLRQWHEKWGDYRFIYNIVLPCEEIYAFDSLAEAGKWFVDYHKLDIKHTKDNKLNYGNIVWGYYKMCHATPTLKKGKYAGWSFIKRERNENTN